MFKPLNKLPANMKFEAPAAALDRWHPEIHAKAKPATDDSTINIYSTIGEYGDGRGMTASIVSAILNRAKGRDVVVNINSPGGDFFEGLAIHSLLSNYDGAVEVNILGMAASAASVVALSGGTINIAESAFFMIHNAWTLAIGNRHDMKQVADMLQQFDQSMQGLYAKKSGQPEAEIRSMMDATTWIMGSDAVAMGFADGILSQDDLDIVEETDPAYNAAVKKMDVALAKAGMPRSERRNLIKQLSSTPGAAENPTPCAGAEGGTQFSEALAGLLASLTS